LSRNSGHPKKSSRNILHRPPLLNAEESLQLRERLLTEIGALTNSDDLTAWAREKAYLRKISFSKPWFWEIMTEPCNLWKWRELSPIGY
jgi:hypothetical protein